MLRTLKLPTALGHSAKPSWWRVVRTPYFIFAATAASAHWPGLRLTGLNMLIGRFACDQLPGVRQDAEVDEHAEAQIDVAALERLQRARRGAAAATGATARRPRPRRPHDPPRPPRRRVPAPPPRPPAPPVPPRAAGATAARRAAAPPLPALPPAAARARDAAAAGRTRALPRCRRARAAGGAAAAPRPAACRAPLPRRRAAPAARRPPPAAAAGPRPLRRRRHRAARPRCRPRRRTPHSRDQQQEHARHEPRPGATCPEFTKIGPLVRSLNECSPAGYWTRDVVDVDEARPGLGAGRPARARSSPRTAIARNSAPSDTEPRPGTTRRIRAARRSRRTHRGRW